jgi:hypothetical protein
LLTIIIIIINIISIISISMYSSTVAPDISEFAGGESKAGGKEERDLGKVREGKWLTTLV